MKLELEISGGFAPSVTSGRYSLDVASLPEDAQKQVEELVNKLLAAPWPKPNPQLRDAMSYELTVLSGDRKQSVVADDGGLTATMRALIKLIQSLGLRTKR
jgi:hypothetical protein